MRKPLKERENGSKITQDPKNVELKILIMTTDYYIPLGTIIRIKNNQKCKNCIHLCEGHCFINDQYVKEAENTLNICKDFKCNDTKKPFHRTVQLK